LNGEGGAILSSESSTPKKCFGICFNFVNTGAGNKRLYLFKLEGNKMPFAFHILRKPFTVVSSKLFATVAIFYSFASLVPCHILNFLQTSTNLTFLSYYTLLGDV
jgi:hypothetical protein